MIDLATITRQNAERRAIKDRGAGDAFYLADHFLADTAEETIDELVREIERLQAENLTLRGCHCEEILRTHLDTVYWSCPVHGAREREG